MESKLLVILVLVPFLGLSVHGRLFNFPKLTTRTTTTTTTKAPTTVAATPNATAAAAVSDPSLSCTVTEAGNIVRCVVKSVTDPGTLLENLGANCEQDCICDHGKAGGTCETGDIQGNVCICHDDSTLTADQLQQLRQDTCENIRITAEATYRGLCDSAPAYPIVGDACDADCRCGHKAKSGTCIANGFQLKNGDNYGLCQCTY